MMKKTAINAAKAPAAVGPYVHAVQAGDIIFTSGSLGMDPQNGALAEGVEAQARLALQNLGAILEAAGVGFGDVVKTTVFLADMNDFAAVNAIYSEFFSGDSKPARSCVQVAQLPKGGLVEVEAIAVRPCC